MLHVYLVENVSEITFRFENMVISMQFKSNYSTELAKLKFILFSYSVKKYILSSLQICFKRLFLSLDIASQKSKSVGNSYLTNETSPLFSTTRQIEYVSVQNAKMSFRIFLLIHLSRPWQCEPMRESQLKLLAGEQLMCFLECLAPISR